MFSNRKQRKLRLQNVTKHRDGRGWDGKSSVRGTFYIVFVFLFFFRGGCNLSSLHAFSAPHPPQAFKVYLTTFMYCQINNIYYSCLSCINKIISSKPLKAEVHYRRGLPKENRTCHQRAKQYVKLQKNCCQTELTKKNLTHFYKLFRLR